MESTPPNFHSKHESWISIRSLKEAADIKQAYKERSRGSSFSSNSGCVSPDSSITMEWKPNTYINQSICFTSIHDPYCETIDSLQSNEFEPDEVSIKKDMEAMTEYIERKESRLRKMQKNYDKDVVRLREELETANEKVMFLNEEIIVLNETLTRVEQEHTEELQNLQARHERKLHRSKEDLDAIITDFNEKTATLVTEKLQQDYTLEILRLRDEYENKIEEIRVEHELEMEDKEEEYEEMIEELTARASREEAEIYSIETKYEQEMYAKEKKYEEEIERLRNELEGRNKRKPALNFNLFEHNFKEEEIGEYKACIEKLKGDLREKESIIVEEQQTIDELSKELEGAFKKKRKHSIGESMIENDLNSIIGQIKEGLFSNYLDENPSRELEGTLRDLQGKLDFLASGHL